MEEEYMDPRRLVQDAPMSRFQWGIVAVCVLIAALDGFDVLVIAYTAPSLTAAWNLSPSSLGVVFSAGLLGMGIGGALIAPLADKSGRRPMAIASLLLMFLGTVITVFVRDVPELIAARGITGIGIGAALATVNVIALEYASMRYRGLAISLMTIGYPTGAAIGGLISIGLIQAYGWRSVYAFCALLALALIPLVLRFVPESIEFLVSRQPEGAVERCNRILMKLNLPALETLDGLAADAASPRAPLSTALGHTYLVPLIAAGIAYLTLSFSVYFVLSWMPRLLTEMGFSIVGGISGSLLMNLAGAVGCIVYGWFAIEAGARALASLFFLGLFVSLSAFGMIDPAAGAVFAVVVALGFCLFGSVTALYVIVPAAFPPSVRASATGIAMSFGRIGAICGPLAAGVFLTFGWTRASYCLVLAAPVLVTIASLRWIVVRGNIPTPIQPMPEPDSPAVAG
jgi:benzoate transport